MILEDTPGRWRLRESYAALVVGVAMFVCALAFALLSADVLRLDCDRARDRCTFSSRTLVWEPHEGHVQLSAVDYLVDTESVTRAGVNRVVARARYRFVLRDRSNVWLEPESRSALVGDGVRERFIAFRRGEEPAMTRSALHLGHAGFLALFVAAIGAMIALLAKPRDVLFDFSAGRFSVRTAGVRIGRSSLAGALSDIEAIELVPSGTQLGVWLRARSGRRVRIDFEQQGSLARTLSARLGVAMVEQTSAVIAQSPDRRSIALSLAVVFLALGPLALAAVWPMLEGLL